MLGLQLLLLVNCQRSNSDVRRATTLIPLPIPFLCLLSCFEIRCSLLLLVEPDHVMLHLKHLKRRNTTGAADVSMALRRTWLLFV